MRRATCLFVQYTAEYGGSPISGLTVVDVLMTQRMEVNVVFGVPGPLEQEYRARGCKIHYLPHGQWLLGGRFLRWAGRWRWEIQATKAFLRLLRDLRPCLVYANTLMSVSAVIAARALRVPVIWHVREQFTDVHGEMHVPFGGRAVVRWLVRGLPTHTVFVSRAVQTNVVGAKPCAASHVLHNPLERRFFERTCSNAEARKKLGVKDNQSFVVGVPGTLRPVKGHEFLLEAAAQLLAHDQDYLFIISGSVDNAHGERLRQRASALGIADRVQFVGAVTDMRLF
jgi:glycosyltransferase involved in cell wall biosynthesis